MKTGIKRLIAVWIGRAAGWIKALIKASIRAARQGTPHARRAHEAVAQWIKVRWLWLGWRAVGQPQTIKDIRAGMAAESVMGKTIKRMYETGVLRAGDLEPYPRRAGKTTAMQSGRVECGRSVHDWWCRLDPGHAGDCIPRRDGPRTEARGIMQCMVPSAAQAMARIRDVERRAQCPLSTTGDRLGCRDGSRCDQLGFCEAADLLTYTGHAATDRAQHDVCMWCAHPAHGDDRCSRSAEGMENNPDGSRFMCGCVAGWELIQDAVQETAERPTDGSEGSGACEDTQDVIQSPDAATGGQDGACAEEAVDRVCEMCGHTHAHDTQCGQMIDSTAWGRHACACRNNLGLLRTVTNTGPAGSGDVAHYVVGEHDPAFNDLQTYLEGDAATSQAAARRLDQRAVDAGQLSPGAFREAWGELPRRTYDAHKIWCARWRQHNPEQCLVWGDE